MAEECFVNLRGFSIPVERIPRVILQSHMKGMLPVALDKDRT
jgi:hypothetical protein